MRKASFIFVGVVLLLLAGGVVLAVGANYDIGRWVLSGGGGERGSGNYTLTDVIGQPAAGHSESGNFTLEAGFLTVGAPADTTPPADVTNLAVSSPTVSSLNLTWTAPGDDGSEGTASEYDIRYASEAIDTEVNWAAATTVTGEPSPSVAGSSESFEVTGLSSNTTYYFALKTADEVPNLSGLSNSPHGTTSSAPVPPTVALSTATYSVGEGDGNATITVNLSAASAETVTVGYATSDGTATAPDDYTVASGTLTFNSSETSKTFSVSIVDDAVVEIDEAVYLSLSNPSNATLGEPSTAVLTIVDDESGCFIATAAYGIPMAEEIEILREFRDEYLLTNPVGQALVDIYYSVSPPIAKFITEHPSLKPIVRTGLVPAVAMSAAAVNTTAVEKTAIVGLFVLVSVAVAIWVTRRRRRGPEYT